MYTTKLDTAFRLVDPSAHAQELAARGLIPATAAAAVSWRDRISATVTDEQLEAAGVSIADVAAAVEFYTATKANVSRERIGGDAWVHYLGDGLPGYLVTADGYRRGPAGDH